MFSGERRCCRRGGREKRRTHKLSTSCFFLLACEKNPGLCNICALARHHFIYIIYGSMDTFRDVEPPLPLLLPRPLEPLPSKLLPLAAARFRESISFCALVIIAELKSSDAMSMGRRCELKYDASCILAVFSIKSSGLLCMMTARV
jgi:hypothetical protein